jgi:hypothetical protein
MVVIILSASLTTNTCAYPYPGDDAPRAELITYYYSLLYTAKEICGFLLLYHNITLSLRQLKRIKKRIGLRRALIESSPSDVIRSIKRLHYEGYRDYGYRFMWRMLNTHCNLTVSQHTVRLALSVIDPEGVRLRSRNRLRRRMYCNKGPNFLIHMDGYDKLKPYGIAIHGAIDGYSRKLLWLKAGYSNNDPKLIASNFLHFIKRLKRVPRCVRSDCGTENVIVGDLQIALRAFHVDMMSGRNSYSTGRSSANQRIERFWGSLRTSFTAYWRNIFKDMIDAGVYEVGDPVHVEAVRFCFLPVIQAHLDRFSTIWNTHRIRQQTQGDTPQDIPNVLYYQPEVFEAVDHSFRLPCDLAYIDTLMAEYSIEYPRFGCSEEFLQIMELALPLERTDFMLDRSPTEALKLFCYITQTLHNLYPE